MIRFLLFILPICGGLALETLAAPPVVPEPLPPSCQAVLERMALERRPSDFGYLFGVDALLLWQRARAEETRAFLHVAERGKANLTDPFLAAFDDTPTIEFYRTTGGSDPHHSIHWNWGSLPAICPRRTGGHWTLGFLALRSDFEGEQLSPAEMVIQRPVPEERDHHEFHQYTGAQEAIAVAHRAYQFLYREYGAQGAGRRDQLETFRAEDRNAARRTTHFVIHVNGEVVAHIQAQFTRDRSELLNLESHFGLLAREPGELVVELGRLFVADRSTLGAEAAQAFDDFGGRDLLRTLLYQRVFSWLNHDVGATRVVMQMNGRGRDHFRSSGRRGFGQWQFDDGDRLVVDEPERQEWVLGISGGNLLRTEDEEMLSLIRQVQARGARARVTSMAGYGLPANAISWYFRQNELPVLERLRAQGSMPQLLQRVDFPTGDEPHRYDYGVHRFNPRAAYLYLPLP